MNYRKLGTSDISVSEVSLGCWTMGGLNRVNGQPNGWANVNEDEVVAAIKTGIDAGVTHFDNADVYGNGRAERMLARAFARLGLDSKKFIIATKIGHFPGTAANAYERRTSATNASNRSSTYSAITSTFITFITAISARTTGTCRPRPPHLMHWSRKARCG